MQFWKKRKPAKTQADPAADITEETRCFDIGGVGVRFQARRARNGSIGYHASAQGSAEENDAVFRLIRDSLARSGKKAVSQISGGEMHLPDPLLVPQQGGGTAPAGREELLQVLETLQRDIQTRDALTGRANPLNEDAQRIWKALAERSSAGQIQGYLDAVVNVLDTDGIRVSDDMKAKLRNALEEVHRTRQRD